MVSSSFSLEEESSDQSHIFEMILFFFIFSEDQCSQQEVVVIFFLSERESLWVEGQSSWPCWRSRIKDNVGYSHRDWLEDGWSTQMKLLTSSSCCFVHRLLSRPHHDWHVGFLLSGSIQLAVSDQSGAASHLQGRFGPWCSVQTQPLCCPKYAVSQGMDGGRSPVCVFPNTHTVMVVCLSGRQKDHLSVLPQTGRRRLLTSLVSPDINPTWVSCQSSVPAGSDVIGLLPVRHAGGALRGGAELCQPHLLQGLHTRLLFWRGAASALWAVRRHRQQPERHEGGRLPGLPGVHAGTGRSCDTLCSQPAWWHCHSLPHIQKGSWKFSEI